MAKPLKPLRPTSHIEVKVFCFKLCQEFPWTPFGVLHIFGSVPDVIFFKQPILLVYRESFSQYFSNRPTDLTSTLERFGRSHLKDLQVSLWLLVLPSSFSISMINASAIISGEYLPILPSFLRGIAVNDIFCNLNSSTTIFGVTINGTLKNLAAFIALPSSAKCPATF